MVSIFIYILSLLLFTKEVIVTGQSLHHQLYTKLTENYVKTTPVKDFFQTVDILTQFRLFQLLNLDGKNEVLSFTGELILTWKDENLVWNETEYNGIWGLTLSVEDVWIPDVNIANSAAAVRDEIWVKYVKLIVFPDGTVNYRIRSDFATTCSLDMTYFPFDTQMCNIDVGLQVYTSNMCNLTTGGVNYIFLDSFSPNGEWSTKETNAEWLRYWLEGIPPPFSMVRFSMVLQRKALFYILNIVVPCLMLSSLTLLVFSVPPDAGEKVSLSITLMLSFTFFMFMISDNLPQTSNHIPILGIYLMVVMGISMLSLVATVAVLATHHKKDSTPVPQWLRFITKTNEASSNKVKTSDNNGDSDTLGDEVFSTLKSDEKMVNYAMLQIIILQNIFLEMKKNRASDGRSQIWKLVARRLDALFFRLFLSLTVIVNGVIVILYICNV